jgi:hypothetical protein
LKLAPDQVEVEWHVWHVVGKPPWTWFGLVVPLKSLAWQPKQSDGVPVNLPFVWHVSQVTLTCAPVNGNEVRLWSKAAGCQAAVPWQTAQVCGKPDCTWFGFVVWLKSGK